MIAGREFRPPFKGMPMQGRGCAFMPVMPPVAPPFVPMKPPVFGPGRPEFGPKRPGFGPKRPGFGPRRPRRRPGPRPMQGRGCYMM